MLSVISLRKNDKGAAMKKMPFLFLFVILLQHAATALAGGPLQTDWQGRPVVYPASSMPIPYMVDRGDLGLFANAQATGLVDECFGVWQSVQTVSVSFQNAGYLPVDVTADNAADYFDENDGISPVIFDSDGSIIDSFYGYGASEKIIGFSGSSTRYDDSNGLHYTEGLSLLNGRFTEVFTTSAFKATFVHEFGHFIGLDHTQINLEYVRDNDTANDIYIPTMFPTATDNDSSLGRLNPDDEAAVTMLYPGEENIVNAAYGRISGRLRWRSGLPVRGANVVAVKQGDELMSRFSSVSDYWQQGDGSFEMLVTPGTYSFFVEPIDPRFTGGSSVGPYADTVLSRSFVFPVIATEYDQTVTVGAGQTQTVDFVARRNWLNPLLWLIGPNETFF
jgi:hypothetical protein